MQISQHLLYSDTINESYDEQEKRVLANLLYECVENKLISFPDRHSGAVKVKEYIITLGRYDGNFSYGRDPETEFIIYIKEV